MSDQNFSGSAGQAGSHENVPTNDGVGQTENTSDTNNYEEMYKQLEQKFGEQGRELGEWRKFNEQLKPLLSKLDESPETVQAIMDGKLTSEMAKAVSEGKVTLQDAKAVTQAHTEVKKDLGKEKYEAATSEEIAKLVEEKVSEVRTELQSKLQETEEIRKFEQDVASFMSNTPDFGTYAKDIDKWLDENDSDDIKVAYYAVKGELSEKEAKAKAEKEGIEANKQQAIAAGGGRSNGTTVVSDPDLIDSLVGNISNPNTF